MTEIIHLIKGYLGYDTLVIQKFIGDDKIYLDSILDVEFRNIYDYLLGFQNPIYPQIEWFKLKLIPLESLTKKQTMELYRLVPLNSNAKHVVIRYIQQYQDNLSKNVLEYLHKNHIDYQDLIDKGYAIKKDQEND